MVTLVFSPLVETAGHFRQRADGERRPQWRWRRLLRPESVVWLLSAVGLTAAVVPFGPARPAPYGWGLVAAVTVLGLGSSAAQGLVYRARAPRAVPDLRASLRGSALWALVAAGVLGGAAWAVRHWTLPFVRGESAPTGREAAVADLLRWLDGQVRTSLFGPSFAQWYWPLLVAVVALVIGGGSAALREWPARRAQLRDPFADAPEGERSPQLRDTAQVFLSYSHADTDFARRYDRALKEHGRKVWADWNGIYAADKWRWKIFEALRDSDAVIVLISRNSLGSHWCWGECEKAIELGKRILPVLISPAPAGSVTDALKEAGWESLTEYERLAMTGPADFDQGVQGTLKFLGRWARSACSRSQ